MSVWFRRWGISIEPEPAGWDYWSLRLCSQSVLLVTLICSHWEIWKKLHNTSISSLSQIKTWLAERSASVWQDDHNLDECTGITFHTLAALVVFLFPWHFLLTSLFLTYVWMNLFLHTNPSVRTRPDRCLLLSCSVSGCNPLWETEVCVCLSVCLQYVNSLNEAFIALQAQEKVSARLRTCSAAQVTHSPHVVFITIHLII